MTKYSKCFSGSIYQSSDNIKITIKDGVSTTLYAANTVDTVDSVDMVADNDDAPFLMMIMLSDYA